MPGVSEFFQLSAMKSFCDSLGLETGIKLGELPAPLVHSLMYAFDAAEEFKLHQMKQAHGSHDRGQS